MATSGPTNPPQSARTAGTPEPGAPGAATRRGPAGGETAPGSGAIDLDRAAALAFRVWTYKQGELVSLMIHLGDRLGLYQALAGSGEVDAAGLADRTELNERWLLEWLRSQAAAGIIDTADGELFSMSPESAAVMADSETSLLFAGGAFQGPLPPETVEGLAEAFRTGMGLSYEELGPVAAHTTERMLGPWSRLALVPQLVPRVEGLESRLESGARVADLGCGTATAISALAEAFPASSFVGYDPSGYAIELGERRIRELGLTNVELVRDTSAAMPEEPTFDLVLTFDCLHDMTDPEGAMGDVRRAIAEDGIWLVKEVKAKGTWEENLRNPMLAMMYSTSVATCLSSATSEEGGAGLGTLGLPPELLSGMAEAAGFLMVSEHDIGDPANMYYELRPRGPGA